MKKVIRTFFFFSKRERIGVAILLGVLVLCLLAPATYSFFKKESAVDFSKFNAAIALLERENPVNNNTTTNIENNSTIDVQLFTFDPNTISKDSMLLLGISSKLANTISNYRNKGGKFYQPEGFKKMYGLSNDQYQQLRPYIHIQSFGKPKPVYASNTKTSEKPEIVLHSFDPNTATAEELQQLGFSKKVSGTLLKFRSKGGQFYKKEDLKKIYGLSEKHYQQLEPFINIAPKDKSYNNTNTTYAKADTKEEEPKTVNLRKPIQIDINKASAEEWQSLYGIGPSYAKRITNYRTKLGGFISIQQVAETYGIPDSTFQKIQSSLVASPILQKIPINSCDAKALSNHPYIKYQLANTIIAYRKQHGSFKTLEDLKAIVPLGEETFEKIKPYLSVE